MAEISLLVMLAIVIVSGIIIFKVVKGIVQALLLTSAVAAVVLAVAAGFVMMDAMELKEKFPGGGKLLLLADADNQLIGAVTANGTLPDVLAEAELEALRAPFQQKDYESIIGSNYKLIVLRETILPDGLQGSIPDSARILQQLAVLSDPLLLIFEYKKGGIIIYPETPVFQAVRILPEWLFREVGERLLKGSLQEEAVGKAQAATG